MSVRTGDNTPVNEVRLNESGTQWVIDRCVICGGMHRHGAVDEVVANGGRAHRVSQCGGYFIELAEAAGGGVDG